MLNICARRGNICRAIHNFVNNSVFCSPTEQIKRLEITPKPSETRQEHRALKTKLDKQNALIALFMQTKTYANASVAIFNGKPF